ADRVVDHRRTPAGDEGQHAKPDPPLHDRGHLPPFRRAMRAQSHAPQPFGALVSAVTTSAPPSASHGTSPRESAPPPASSPPTSASPGPRPARRAPPRAPPAARRPASPAAPVTGSA